jgi:three-Cys-motif partner protein
MESDQFSFDEVKNWEVPPTLRGNLVEIGQLPAPIWTETKARLIQNYLRFFLYITKHGVYIDGFSGPQDKGNSESWAAKLVLELQPPWMKSFFLCELNKSSFTALGEMVASQPKISGRRVILHNGNFNNWVDEILQSELITDKKATFALLDQRTTECQWGTVRKLSEKKKGDTKIELFYFFPTGWIHRTISASEDHQALDAWWGDKGWCALKDISQSDAAMKMADKIRSLGYRDVKMWPICSKDGGAGRTMYHMIHATDHLEAPKLMYRAYKDLIGGVTENTQIPLQLPIE